MIHEITRTNTKRHERRLGFFVFVRVFRGSFDQL